MKRLFAAVSMVVFALPGFADEAPHGASHAQGPTSAIGSHDVGGTDPRHISAHSSAAGASASVGSGSVHGAVPNVGPTSAVGSHDVGGTDPRHVSGGSYESSSRGASRSTWIPRTGPTDPIGSAYVGGTDTRY